MMIPVFSEQIRQPGISGHFRGDGHSFIKSGKKRNEIRDQDRSAETDGNGMLFPVKFTDLSDYGIFLKKKIPGALDSQLPGFIQGKPAFLTFE